MNQQIKSDFLYERYKEEKLQISSQFIKILLRTLTITALLYLFLSQFVFLTLKLEISLFLLLMLGAGGMITSYPHWRNFIGAAVTLFVSIGTIQVGFDRFPDYIGIFSGLSCFFLWHCHLKFVYNRAQGHVVIILHAVIYGYFASNSGFVKGLIPADVIFTLVLLTALQLLWYRHVVRKEYEGLTRKIELEISHSNVKNLIDAIPEGIVVLNKELDVLMSNKASAKLLEGQGVFQLQINEKFNIKQRNTCVELIKNVSEFKESVETAITFGVCSTNNYHLECTGSKMQWNNQLAIVLTFREVSNIIKLQSEVDLTSKTLKILQGISHELKTPLNKIINDHRDTLKNTDIVEPIREYISKSYSSAKYLLSLIKDMIDYSNIKFNNLKLNFEWVKLDELISGCIHMYKTMNKDYKIVYKNKNPESIIVHTDKIRLDQCLLNLLFFSLG